MLKVNYLSADEAEITCSHLAFPNHPDIPFYSDAIAFPARSGAGVCDIGVVSVDMGGYLCKPEDEGLRFNLGFYHHDVDISVAVEDDPGAPSVNLYITSKFGRVEQTQCMADTLRAAAQMLEDANKVFNSRKHL